MDLTAFVFGPEQRAELDSLRLHALNNVVGVAAILRMASGARPPIGEDPAFRRELRCCPLQPEIVVRLVLSVEDQPHGECFHLSVSMWPPTEINGSLPHPALVETLMILLQFPKDIRGCVKIWVEGDTAINLLQPVEKETAGA